MSLNSSLVQRPAEPVPVSSYAVFPRCGFTFFRRRQFIEDVLSLSLSLQATEIFLTHDWADDELGRSNHERVHPNPRLARGLAAHGPQQTVTWNNARDSQAQPLSSFRIP